MMEPWVKKQEATKAMSLVALPHTPGSIVLRVMPGTWRPETNAKKPNAILYLTADDLRELLAIAEGTA